MKAIFCFLVFISVTSFLPNKVRLLHLDKILNDAKQIRTIVVSGYTDSTLLYHYGNKDSIKSISSRNRPSSEQFRKNLIKSKYMDTLGMAGLWPQIGDTVLMIITEKKWPEVFAKKTNSLYRFWDPNNIPFANSIFIFPAKPPFYQLPICRQIPVNSSEYLSCEDGCLVDVASVKEK